MAAQVGGNRGLFRPTIWAVMFSFTLLTLPAGEAAALDEAQLQRRFDDKIRPFVETFCVSCHGKEKTKADLDLDGLLEQGGMRGMARDHETWETVLERVQAEEMPPEKAQAQPTPKQRQEMVDWIMQTRAYAARQHAGDPGVVLLRRLSNVEYNYTIRDLTGVDIRPTQAFAVDPANQAGFDNSGESLVMSPTLLQKYLAAARWVASHMYLKREGFAFAPHPMLVDTDRDKFFVHRIIDFYHRQNTHYADYFYAAWRYRHREVLGLPDASLHEVALHERVSPKYLGTIWATLEEREETFGPLAKLQAMWRRLPTPHPGQADMARVGCEQMHAFVTELRKKVERRFLNITAGEVSTKSQPLLIWKNVQYAMHRMTFDPAQLQVEGEAWQAATEVNEPGTESPWGPGKTRLIKNVLGDPDLQVPADARTQYEAAFARFCRVFPDMFYKAQRGRNYFDTSKDRGRYLSAGFHSRMGYFRDDLPLYELILDEQGQTQLDELWNELDLVASATHRMYRESAPKANRWDHALGVEESASAENDESRDVTSEEMIKALAARFLDQAREGDSEVGIQAIEDYFVWINERIRWVERTRIESEPGHLEALQRFAARAYRRPLTRQERETVLAFYRQARQGDGLDHESAVRESIVGVLMAPDFCYRLDLVKRGAGIEALSDHDLASRLSYFLWSSMPDEALLARAAAGDLHEPAVLVAQTRRMLTDPRARALALEFGGNWLDFRHFQEQNTVDLKRFPSFTPALQRAMFEEPVRLLLDVIQADRSLLDLLYAHDTFVNPVLARHYRMPVLDERPDHWVRVENAYQYGRGGLLPMALFLTHNAPGLRTSPVKRGHWLVTKVLGERIPPPPPLVPELPEDEADLDLSLREMLARHRNDAACAPCHERFDALGLVFEGYGPIGELRQEDLGGRVVDSRAVFPGGGEGEGLWGVLRYLKKERQDEFIENFCGKLLAYALGRSLVLSDDETIRQMQQRLTENEYRFASAVEYIVTSPQFLTKRGPDGLAAKVN